MKMNSKVDLLKSYNVDVEKALEDIRIMGRYGFL